MRSALSEAKTAICGVLSKPFAMKTMPPYEHRRLQTTRYQCDLLIC
jgi:hypothetical protein